MNLMEYLVDEYGFIPNDRDTLFARTKYGCDIIYHVGGSFTFQKNGVTKVTQNDPKGLSTLATILTI